jgi:FkbM family methyltransferase
VRYHAQFVGLPESHPFVQKRRAEAGHWPHTNIWDRVTAGALERRSRLAAGAARGAEMANPSSVIGVDQIPREHGLPTVDFLKVDVDGSDPEVLESARTALVEQKVLGVGMEVNWFGTIPPNILFTTLTA